MPNDAKHHASVFACKDTQLGDSKVYTIWASERVGRDVNIFFFIIITDPLRGSTPYLATVTKLRWLSGKLLGIDSALLPNRQWNQKQKPKKQPWGKVECFAFGGATVRFASLETSFHAANHTIPPPPSHEGYPLSPKDKNRSPFHGEKPLIVRIISR